jgi:branched-subunit amino acid aminotransferase/4-amino-4-deoxychorismate lyase
MYLRPLLLGTGPTLGLQPAPEVTFVIFSAAVGSYFAGGAITPIHLKVEQAFHRAAPRGVGAAKCAGAVHVFRSIHIAAEFVYTSQMCIQIHNMYEYCM